jgi:hypothetical protein
LLVMPWNHSLQRMRSTQTVSLSPHITSLRHVSAALRAAPCVCMHLFTAPTPAAPIHTPRTLIGMLYTARDVTTLGICTLDPPIPLPLSRRFDLALGSWPHSPPAHTPSSRRHCELHTRLVVTTHTHPHSRQSVKTASLSATARRGAAFSQT